MLLLFVNVFAMPKKTSRCNKTMGSIHIFNGIVKVLKESVYYEGDP